MSAVAANVARRQALESILRSATPLLLEGYSATPGSDPERARILGTEAKSSHKDLVTVFDKRVEQFLVGELSRIFPGEKLVGEESVAGKKISGAEAVSQAGSHFWLIDPIDGTTNYSRAYPFFCSTAAFVERSSAGEYQVLAGAVWDPVHQEMFSASRGGGAWLNRTRLQVSAVSDHEKALLTTGFASERATSGERPYELFKNLTKQTLGVRRDGSAALDLSYVAAGRIDGYWEWGLSPWDTAAGICLVTEAQGRVSALSDQPIHFESGEILASNGFLHKWLVKSLGE